MRNRILLALAVVATLGLAACGESSTAPRVQPGVRSNDDIICRSGYHIATRADGSQFCEEDGSEGMRSSGGGNGKPPGE